MDEVNRETVAVEEEQGTREIQAEAEIDPAREEIKDTPAAEEIKEVKSETPPISYMIRILCGGYLIYLSYQLFTGEGASKPLIIAAAAFFVLTGLFLICISIRDLLKKKDQGKPDGI